MNTNIEAENLDEDDLDPEKALHFQAVTDKSGRLSIPLHLRKRYHIIPGTIAKMKLTGIVPEPNNNKSE